MDEIQPEKVFNVAKNPEQLSNSSLSSTLLAKALDDLYQRKTILSCLKVTVEQSDPPPQWEKSLPASQGPGSLV